MTKHGSGKVLVIAAAVLCLFFILVFHLPLSGRPDPIQAAAADGQQQPEGRADTEEHANIKEGGHTNVYSKSYENDYTDRQTTESAVIAAGAADRPATTLQCIHYTKKDFFKSVNAAAKSNTELTADSAPIVGGVVPHHLLAANMIAGFFQSVSQYPPDTIVVVGPNHRRIGSKGLNTSSLDWKTEFGILEADRELIGKLIGELNAAENDSLMELEHSVSGLVPYIKYYLPDTKIVPILLHGNYSAADSKKLGKFLSAAMKDNPKLTVIASIDFSHYLDADTADRMDEITLKAIESRDENALIMMGNDNIDSPPSILTLLAAMDGIGAEGPQVTGHSNSYVITGGGADYTTSYYTMLFRRRLDK